MDGYILEKAKELAVIESSASFEEWLDGWVSWWPFFGTIFHSWGAARAMLHVSIALLC